MRLNVSIRIKIDKINDLKMLNKFIYFKFLFNHLLVYDYSNILTELKEFGIILW